MTRRGIERQRFLVVISMMLNGATFAEALAYIELIHPFEGGEK